MRRGLHLIPLLFFLAFVGCQSGEQVTISGAVHKTGSFDYRAGWKVADYIREADGYTDEAVIADAYLVRVMPDSLDDGKITSIRITLTDSLSVLSGDAIVVPGQVYAVRLDTVRAVQNVRLETEDGILKIDQGVIVPGWTPRGVVVAMLIGRGKVFEVSDTTTAVSAFHYLYVHLHPEEYHRLRRFAGDVVDSFEALEDVHAVHEWLFVNRDYQEMGEAELPPTGYFEVLQGIWLAPRNASMPGKGMRKRRFDDGRIWTTFGDGRQRWQLPNGQVEVVFRSGSKEVRFPDGRVSFSGIQGHVRTTHPDGREVWVLKSGTRSTFFPNGRMVRRGADGNVVIREEDGTQRTEFASGAVDIRYPDGRVFIRDNRGRTETRYPDGKRVVITPEKDEITLFADGSQETRKADGTVVRFSATGSVVKEHASGTITRVSGDGVRTDIFPDGTTRVVLKDGSRTVRYIQGDVLEVDANGYSILRRSDGSILETFPDGRTRGQLTNGSSWEVFPDGRKIEVAAGGHKLEIMANGQRQATLSGLYDYPTSLRDDLATVDSLPDRLEKGDWLHVKGTVAEQVVNMSISAFHVPFGDVVEANVKRRKGKFEGSLRFKEEGHYRVQVQVELPGIRIFTAVHHAVVVGQSYPLEQAVFPLVEYPGDREGALVLIDLANRERIRLNRRVLKVDEDLMDIAQSRLREMVLKGEVSHVSISGENVRDHMIRKRMRFLAVNENVASARFLEMMHWGWMMSAGHRKTLLNPRWVYFGVAVTEVNGMLWGVQVFAGW